jgi:hypothetical protein
MHRAANSPLTLLGEGEPNNAMISASPFSSREKGLEMSCGATASSIEMAGKEVATARRPVQHQPPVRHQAAYGIAGVMKRCTSMKAA